MMGIASTPTLGFVSSDALGMAKDIAWPIVTLVCVLVLLLTQKQRISDVLSAISGLVGGDWDKVSLKIPKILDIETSRSAKNAKSKSLSSEVPKSEKEAAERVSEAVSASSLTFVKSRMLSFAREYETTRANMGQGPLRTSAMNEIVAKMRTLALAAEPFVAEFADDGLSPGKRLAAICILQLSPSPDYIAWLVERMRVEQPFIFFHASVALLSIARSYGASRGDEVAKAIREAHEIIAEFKGGPPDQNTLDVLEQAASMLELARRGYHSINTAR